MGPARRAAVSALLLAVLASCTPGGPDDVPDEQPSDVTDPDDDPQDPDASRRGGTLRIGLSADPISIDPRFVVDDSGELVVDALFDPLVRLDRNLRVVPAAAARWDVVDDRVFTFHLRDATFHDGTPVRAEDFVRTFDRIVDGTADPPTFLEHLLEPVAGWAASRDSGVPLAGLQAADARTLVIELQEPRPGFLLTLTDPSLVPVPALADADPEGYGLQPIGNGPFEMASAREPGAFLRLTRAGDHPEPPLLDEVLFTIYADDPTRDRRWQDLRDGVLHVAEVAPAHFAEAEQRFGRAADGYTGPGLLRGVLAVTYLYGFDTTSPPFDDARVRRALSLAIDREALADEVLQGLRTPATSIVPPPILGSRPGACLACRHDPERARALLDEVRAGWEEAAAQAAIAAAEQVDEDVPEDVPAEEEGSDDPGQEPSDDVVGEGDDAPPTEPQVLERITLTYNRGPTHAAIAERIADDIEAALGLEVDVRAQDLQPFVRAVRAGEVSVFRLGWEANVPDPGAFLVPLFHSSNVGTDNLTRFADPELDLLLGQALTANDPAEARRLWATAERLLLDALPALPLLWYQHAAVVATDVQDLHWSPLGRLDLSAAWLTGATG